MSCPVHDSGFDGYQDRAIPRDFRRSKSIDVGYTRPNVSMHRALQREMSADCYLRGRKPFLHSHSVNCAVYGSNLSTPEDKARSVGSLVGSARPRPNVLELCPNHNTSFNAYRRRYSRSSERSLDFEAYYLNEFGSTFSNFRSSRRSSSRDSGRSFNAFANRNETGGQGRWTNIKKGFSLLSLCTGNDELEDEHRYQPTKILRPPTRHFHHRGISGLPVKCRGKYMGLAY